MEELKKELKCGMDSKEAIVKLKAYSKFLRIDVLDQMEYYLSGRTIRLPKILDPIE